MKRIVLLFVACVCFSTTGCLSAVIAESGKRLSNNATREELDACFGQPRKVEDIDGEVKLTYITRKKISDGSDSIFLAWYTLGLSEPPLIAYYSLAALYHMIAGQEITYTYNKSGHLIEYSRDKYIFGFERQTYSGGGKREEKQKEQEADVQIIIPPIIEILNPNP